MLCYKEADTIYSMYLSKWQSYSMYLSKMTKDKNGNLIKKRQDNDKYFFSLIQKKLYFVPGP